MSAGPPAGAAKPSRCKGMGMPVLRSLGFLSGATVIALGIYDISQNSTSIGVVVNNVYRVLFGLLIMMAELRWTSLLEWFSFLTFFGGLGAFYIFVGGLAMGGAWYEIALAILMCTIGLLYLASACACNETGPVEASAAGAAAGGAAAGTGNVPADHESGNASAFYNEMEDGQSRRSAAKQPLNDNPFGDSAGNSYGKAHSQAQAARPAYGVSGQEDHSNPFAGAKPRASAYD